MARPVFMSSRLCILAKPAPNNAKKRTDARDIIIANAANLARPTYVTIRDCACAHYRPSNTPPTTSSTTIAEVLTVMAATISLKDRFRGSLLGLAVGDAVGTTVQTLPRGSFPPLTDMVGGGKFYLQAGQVSLISTEGTKCQEVQCSANVPLTICAPCASIALNIGIGIEYPLLQFPQLYSLYTAYTIPSVCLSYLKLTFSSSPHPLFQWTDSPSMALCLAESLIEKGAFDPMDQGSRYWRWYHVSTPTTSCHSLGNRIWRGFPLYTVLLCTCLHFSPSMYLLSVFRY